MIMRDVSRRTLSAAAMAMIIAPYLASWPVVVPAVRSSMVRAMIAGGSMTTSEAEIISTKPSA